MVKLLAKPLIQLLQLHDYLPFAIYLKDSNGTYLGRNLFAAQQMTAFKLEEKLNQDWVLGRTDQDIFDENTAKNIMTNDTKLLDSNSGILYCKEGTLLPTGHTLEQLSIKQRIVDDETNAQYIFGCTVNMQQLVEPNANLNKIVMTFLANQLRHRITLFMANTNLNILDDVIAQFYCLISFYKESGTKLPITDFTHREIQCFCLAAKGLSAKQMSQILTISYRTVEIYLDKAKEKLGLTFKTELISFFWQFVSSL